MNTYDGMWEDLEEEDDYEDDYEDDEDDYEEESLVAAPSVPESTSSYTDDEAFLHAILGDDALVLQSRLSQFKAEEKLKKELEEKAKVSVAVEIKAIEAKVASKTGFDGFDAYKQWLLNEQHYIITMLEGLYPGNVELIDRSNFITDEKKSINEEYNKVSDVSKFGASIVAMLNSKKGCEITIRFPELTMKNSRGNSHVIKDMYIFIDLSCLLRLQHGFRGLRGTLSYAEYNSGYSHSHMQSSRGDMHAGGFCLGDTTLSDTVRRGLTTPYDRLKFELFCIQIKDYLCWESLEGGPYMRMAEIRVESNRRRFQPPSSADLNSYFSAFMEKHRKVPIQLEDNGYAVKIEVIKNLDLWKMVTEITSGTHKLPFDSVKGATYEEAATVDVNYAEIVRINENLAANRAMHKFKGVDIKPQIEVIALPKEEKKKELMAHESVLNHIAATLEKNLNECYQDEFAN